MLTIMLVLMSISNVDDHASPDEYIQIEPYDLNSIKD